MQLLHFTICDDMDIHECIIKLVKMYNLVISFFKRYFIIIPNKCINLSTGYLSCESVESSSYGILANYQYYRPIISIRCPNNRLVSSTPEIIETLK